MEEKGWPILKSLRLNQSLFFSGRGFGYGILVVERGYFLGEIGEFDQVLCAASFGADLDFPSLLQLKDRHRDIAFLAEIVGQE